MNGRTWTPEEDRLIIEQYDTVEAEIIGRQLGRTKIAVYSRARLLGLRKPETYHSLAGKKGTNHPAAVAHRFPKGSVPANKGKKMPPEIYAKAAPTMFKPGHPPTKHRDVGSERVNVDGYVEIKVAEPNKWRLKQRVIWEQANGPIPRGYNIQFKDGNRLNVHLDNLYIISRAEQLRTRNSIYARYPEELRSAIRVKATLKRQITLYQKNSYEQQSITRRPEGPLV